MNPEDISPYARSWRKRWFDLVVCGVVLGLGWPIGLLLWIIVWILIGKPIFFGQKRVGRGGKSFVMYKFRTMAVGADKDQGKYLRLNEVDGPVFKIRNDTRYLKLGKWLAWSGLDELPQIGNVIFGQMSIVGPRPLPVREWLNMPQKYQNRTLIKPGITSLWVVRGAHQLSFEQWMKLDNYYLKQATVGLDLKIMLRTLTIPAKVLFTFLKLG